MTDGEQALTIYESPHDTFDSKKHKNWLLNGAGLGFYAHGRVHQEVDFIYVGDMVHKRGHKATDDLLLMEEQALDSMGEPLSAPSRLGGLRAMAVLPTMNTANGEGDLIAYYDRGVVAFNTHEAPRETRVDGVGSIVQRGWDMKRLVNHLLNTVGAVGRYAVTTLTRDHFFRSTFGLHFLKVILGEGTFNSENTNRISQDVEPLLNADKELDGAATGFWISGNRMTATTGLVANEFQASSSYGRGFVVWNQAVSFTQDRTPIPAWEGLWLMDQGITGIHKFVDVDTFGFISSDANRNIYLSTVQKSLDADRRAGKEIPVAWQMTTGQFAPHGLDKRGAISEGTLEVVVSDSSQKIKVWIRTDVATKWRLWKEFNPCDKVKEKNQKLRLLESLGKPPLSHRECTWFQVKIEGVGYAEDFSFSLDSSPTTAKSGRKQCAVIDATEDNYFDLYKDASN